MMIIDDVDAALFLS